MPLVPAKLSTRDTRPEHPLGQCYDDPLDGSRFRYIKFDEGDDTNDAVVGYACMWYGAKANWTVTTDISVSTVQAYAGFAQAAFSDGEYGWIQTRGPNRQNITTDGGVSAKEKLTIHATSDGQTDTMADGLEEAVCAVAIAADGTTTATILDPGEAFIECE